MIEEMRPQRKEIIESVRAGQASPTPEFAAQSASQDPGLDANEVKEGDEMMSNLQDKISGMSLEELDAFQDHIGKILPIISAETDHILDAINARPSQPTRDEIRPYHQKELTIDKIFELDRLVNERRRFLEAQKQGN